MDVYSININVLNSEQMFKKSIKYKRLSKLKAVPAKARVTLEKRQFFYSKTKWQGQIMATLNTVDSCKNAL